MMITINCDCGNEVTINAMSKRFHQFKDELNEKHLYFDLTELKQREMVLTCDKCKNWITLGMD